jgi:hypothetical protein
MWEATVLCKWCINVSSVRTLIQANDFNAPSSSDGAVARMAAASVVRFAEDGRPLSEGKIGGDGRDALVEPADEMDQKLFDGLGKWQVSRAR